MSNNKRLRICKKGHILTSDITKSPISANYCAKCGSEIISECPSCNKTLESPYIVTSIKSFQHCKNCGKPYPWHNQQ